LILITLILRPALLVRNTPLFVSLSLLIKTATILLRLILPQLLSASLLVDLSPLQLVVLSLLVLGLSLLIETLLLLTLSSRLTLLLVSLSPLLVLRLSLLVLGLSPLLVLRLSLLVLRLSFVVPALSFSLPVLFIVLIATAAPATFVLRLSGLGVPLLPFCSLSLTVLAVPRLLSVREAARSWQKHCSYRRGQRHAIKVIASHNLSPSKDRAEGKVISLL